MSQLNYHNSEVMDAYIPQPIHSMGNYECTSARCVETPQFMKAPCHSWKPHPSHKIATVIVVMIILCISNIYDKKFDSLLLPQL